MTAAALLAVAVLWSVAVPRALNRLPLTAAPGTGLALWLAVSVGSATALLLGLLSLTVTLPGLAAAVAHTLSSCLHALEAAFPAPSRGPWWHLAGAALMLLLTARWVTVSAARARSSSRRRLAQHDLLRLVARPLASDSDVFLVEHETPLVYCVPGRRSMVVVTRGARDTLSPQELAAAISHERAHLEGRHGAVISLAENTRRALPLLPACRQAPQAIAALIELVADDRAARRHGATTVASALFRLGAGAAPAGTLGAGGGGAAARARRLLTPSAPMSPVQRSAAHLATVALLVVPVAVAVSPRAIAMAVEFCSLV